MRKNRKRLMSGQAACKFLMISLLLIPGVLFAQDSAEEKDKSRETNKKKIDKILATDEELSSGFGVTYRVEGRRDPFVNPMSRIPSGGEEGTERPPGLAGMLVDEATIMGITDTEEGPIAIFMGTDNRGHFARVGDNFWDAQIVAIDVIEGIVIVEQRLQDITLPTRTRERQIKLHP